LLSNLHLHNARHNTLLSFIIVKKTVHSVRMYTWSCLETNTKIDVYIQINIMYITQSLALCHKKSQHHMMCTAYGAINQYPIGLLSTKVCWHFIIR